MGHGTFGRFFNLKLCRPGLKASQGSRRCSGPNKPFQLWREETLLYADRSASDRPVRGLFPKGEERKDVAMVFVLDRHKKPLMPCTPKRARLLLARGRAVVHRVQPFVIRLRDRRVAESRLQPVAIKIDPGSHTTGIALARVEQREAGEVHHALLLAEVVHRGEQV